MFAQNGYKNTTTLEIAQRLGISEASIFYYFGSKKELAMVIIEEWYDYISQDLKMNLAGIQGTRPKLTFIIRQHLEHLLFDKSGLCAMILGEGRSMDQEMQALIGKCKNKYFSSLMELLDRASAQGEIRKDIPPWLIRDIIFGTTERVFWDSVSGTSAPDVDMVTTILADMIWSALQLQDDDRQKLEKLKNEMYGVLEKN